MGVSACISFHARYRDGSHRRHDQGKAAADDGRTARRLAAGLILLFAAGHAAAEGPIRFATYTVDLQRDGPGLLLRDILRGTEDVETTARIIARVAPDVLLLTGIDYDAHALALQAYTDRIKTLGGPDYAYRAAPRSNSGRPTGLDVDGDGLLGGPRDAHGYGDFAGRGAVALLSVYPLGRPDLTASQMLWSNAAPDSRPDGMEDAVWATLRLMERGGWTVAAATPLGAIELWAAYASPPVFDGPEDRNGLRNAAQIDYWRAKPQEGPTVLLGDLNVDPVDGEGRKDALQSLLERFNDPRPASAGAAAVRDETHLGEAALDTVDWSGGPGNLRVDYVLPSRHLKIAGAGVFWPAPESPDAGLLGGNESGATRHRLVWVDLVPEH